MKGIKILGIGAFAPSNVVSNDDFSKIVDTSDEWIYSRTGMKKRHLSKGEPTWFLAKSACEDALKKSGLKAEDIDLIIVATITPDYFTPSMACIIQRELGIEKCIAVDVNAACSGFIYGIDMASKYIACGDARNAIVVGAENLSKITDYTDRASCVLFGDGAGACVLTAGEGTFATYLGADGSGAKFMVARQIPPRNMIINGDEPEFDDGIPKSKEHYLFMDGKEVYKFAIKALPHAVEMACKKAGISVEDIALIIPHQANIRIIETAAQRLGVPMDKMQVNIEEYGNTSSASIPLALNEAYEKGKVKKGDKVCLVGFGAGLTYGAVLYEI